MADLTLALKGVYFDQIKDGSKVYEYRLRNAYWTKRLAKAPFRNIVLTKGYPSSSDTARRMVLPWQGFIETTITHPHFGPESVDVFAIIVDRAAAAIGKGAKP